jgi:mono/diheme cytochrome c family protein
MAATDAFYRNVKTMHVVFAVSCVVMLATIVAMFADDYYRDWKVEQRAFRGVEEEIAKRGMLSATPSKKALGEIAAAEKELGEAKAAVQVAKRELEAKHGELLTRKAKAEARKQTVKADFDSVMSFVSMAQEHNDAGAEQENRAKLATIKQDLDNASADLENLQQEYDAAAKETGLTDAINKLKDAEKGHKDLLADFDRFVKLVSQKHWSWKDDLRALPILDGFASPTKIQQFTLNDLPIDYSFKYVTRYDRCTTCHMGIDRTGYEKDKVAALTEEPNKDLINSFHVAEQIINQRRSEGAKDLPDPSRLRPERLDLSAARVTQFSSHPRLDLFVDANSKHPAEKFGCTICHGGQGSATDFFNASHMANNTPMAERWDKEYGWKSNHFWDYPMLPNRFIEASCVKCHYEITELIRDGTKEEAPKLIRGYNLVREMGCFGCHEISGIKSGRRVGPDLRLEPDPPLDKLSPTEQVKALSDPLNPPGTMRKVGPSLFRVSEKTNEDWIRKWVKSPRGFRPDTRMPHFYMQPNNSPDVLPDDQKKFPDTEINAISAYLLSRSREFVKAVKRYHDLKSKASLTDGEKKELAALESQHEVRSSAPPVSALTLPDEKSNPDRGRMLFSEKGCLACHTHDATASAAKTADGKTIPALVGESDFAPNLSRIALKLGTEAGKPETARKWLVSWLLNPSAHSPRTKMPSVQLTAEDANEIAGWLLSQKPEWTPVDVAPAETATLKSMAKIYLEKVFTKSETRTVLENGFTEERLKQLAADADEQELNAPLDDAKLKMYVGKKAIGNMGCYACHSIPGFQAAKPIGTALNEWGKKDPDRLAFEDAPDFVTHHFNVVDRRDDPKDPSKPAAEWKFSGGKPPFESYFAKMLDHHHRTRDGFLHLKLAEPRSYDYQRIKTWEDRLRMPQFQFAHVKRMPSETDEQFAIRKSWEEARAREAVMTFILGLIAEPVPPKFVNDPTGDRLAEVKGRQVLDKFNCAGCHIVRPGEIDFKPIDLKRFENHPDVRKQEMPYKGDDYVYPNHYSWTGVVLPKLDRAVVRGVTPPVKDEDDDPKMLSVWLTQAFEYKLDGKTRDIPAAGTLAIPKENIVAQFPQLGGKFTELLAQYLQKKDPENYAGTKVSYAFAAAPPTLINEGEKVQPGWLYQFLQDPRKIRPLTVLRMPKFNMSPDDAQALVNYFTATDKTHNPGIGLVYPYVSIPERDEGYLPQRTAEYIARLKQQGKFEAQKKELQPIWDAVLQERLTEAKSRQSDAEKALAAATNDAAKAEAKKLRDVIDAEVKKLEERAAKKDVSDLQRQWEEREAYIADGARLVKHGNICLTCHSVGNTPGKEDKGPNLEQANERLRPDWMQRWITNPTRYLHYTSVMPINFKANAVENQDAFVGPSDEQIRAARDFLILYPQVRDWAVIRKRPLLGMTTPGETKP